MKRNARARLDALEEIVEAREEAVDLEERRREIEEIIRKIDTGEIEPMSSERADELMREIMEDAKKHYAGGR